MTSFGLLIAFLLNAVPVDVSLLDGSRIHGDLEALTADALTISVDGQAKTVPRPDVLQLEFGAPSPAPAANVTEISLTDGTRLLATSLTVTGPDAAVESPSLGTVKTPATSIRSVRFADAADVAAAWDELRNSDSQKDRVIVRKGDTLDFVAGVIGDIRKEEVVVVLGGQEAKVPIGRVFGLVYGARKSAAGGSAGDIQLKNGERVAARTVEFSDGKLLLTSVGGVTASVPAERLAVVDYGRGKIRGLAELPRQVDYKKLNPFWSAEDQARIQSLRIDQVPWGRTGNSSLRTGGKAYSKGLWMHSGTTIRIPLDRQYRKLQALAGLDENPAGRPKVQPKVRLLISLDGKPAFDQMLGWDQAPVSLDIDTTEARLLEIEVQSAGEPGFFGACEHLDLVEAKLIK